MKIISSFELIKNSFQFLYQNIAKVTIIVLATYIPVMIFSKYLNDDFIIIELILVMDKITPIIVSLLLVIFNVFATYFGLKILKEKNKINISKRNIKFAIKASVPFYLIYSLISLVLNLTKSLEAPKAIYMSINIANTIIILVLNYTGYLITQTSLMYCTNFSISWKKSIELMKKNRDTSLALFILYGFVILLVTLPTSLLLNLIRLENVNNVVMVIILSLITGLVQFGNIYSKCEYLIMVDDIKVDENSHLTIAST
jgi:hypothetical protein